MNWIQIWCVLVLVIVLSFPVPFSKFEKVDESIDFLETKLIEMVSTDDFSVVVFPLGYVIVERESL